jgi:hypothetical protein
MERINGTAELPTSPLELEATRAEECLRHKLKYYIVRFQLYTIGNDLSLAEHTI